MNRKRRWLWGILFFLVFAGVSAGACGCGQPAKNKEGVKTVIIHTNDSHGRGAGYEDEGIMGFAAVAALKRDYEAEGANVLVLDAGDTFHGLPIADLNQGENMVDLMNLGGYDAMTVGNHDFNYGSDQLLALAQKADFTILSANVVYGTDGGLFLDAMAVIEQRGIRYGIFGLTSPETTYKTSPEKISGLEFLDPVKTAADCVNRLKELEVDYIIGLMHMGTDENSEYTSAKIAGSVEGIDLIIDGHSHSSYEHGYRKGDTLIASTGEWLKNIGVVTLEPDGTMTAELVGADAYKKRDGAVANAANQMKVEEQKGLNQFIGKADLTLDGRRETVRSLESNLGDWAADVVREATKADAVFLTGGGMRTSIPEGPVTKGTLYTAFPFGNAIVVKEVTGQILLEALEHGLSAAPKPSGAFPQVSGLYVEYDTAKEPGKRVNTVSVSGTPLSEHQIYRIAMTDHVAAGGDDYQMFLSLPVTAEYDSMEEMLVKDLMGHDKVGKKTDSRLRDMAKAKGGN